MLPILPTLLIRTHFATIWGAAVAAFSTFYTTLALSIISYRLSPFHPLAKYPGPSLAKVSKWWGVWVTAHGKQHIYYQKLHQKYGPYVRVGELILFLSVFFSNRYNSPVRTKRTIFPGRRCRDTDNSGRHAEIV